MTLCSLTLFAEIPHMLPYTDLPYIRNTTCVKPSQAECPSKVMEGISLILLQHSVIQMLLLDLNLSKITEFHFTAFHHHNIIIEQKTSQTRCSLV